MPPDVVQLLLNAGLSGILLYQLNIVYQDGKADRAQLIATLGNMQSDLSKLRERLIKIETHIGMDEAPTTPLRPTSPA